MNITIKWGRERFYLPIPSSDTKLASLRQHVSDQTHLPVGTFKLIFAGGIMKDDSAPISAFGLTEGCNVHVIGTSAIDVIGRPSGASARSVAKPSEGTAIAAIQGELNKINSSMRPSLDEFIARLHANELQSQSELEFEHKRIGELLLQSLLRLDALMTDSQWSDARQERKKAVKQIQGMLEELDDGWQQFSLTARNT